MFDISKYPNVYGWYQRCQRAMADYDYQEINQVGSNMIRDTFKKKLDAM